MSIEAEEIVREVLLKNGKSTEEIEQFLQKARGEKHSILQVMERCLELAPSIEKACQQAIDKHGNKKK